MATPSKLKVPLVFGRADTIDPKHAPYGVLAQGRNLRVREDGRLGSRHGYAALTMTTRNGTLVANDLFRFGSRLCALGSDAGDGYPTDVFEYTGLASELWRGSDPKDQRVTINPVTAMREVGGVPHVEGGVQDFDAAGGGGYVFLVYRTGERVFGACFREGDDQAVFLELLGATPVTHRVTWSVDRFYLAFTNSSNAVIVRSFKPGTDTSTQLVGTVKAADGNAVTALDICPVTNPTNAAFVVGWDDGAAASLTVEAYNSAGTQQGTTITVSSTTTTFIALEADEADDTINLYRCETNVGSLTTFNFDSTIQAGPTTTVAGPSGGICRLPAQGSFEESVAVAVNESGNGTGVTVSIYNLDDHAEAITAYTVERARLTTKLVSGQSAGHDDAVVFGGYFTAAGPVNTLYTNALFFCSVTNVHNAVRDFTKASIPSSILNLSLDASTGRLLWPAARLDDGSSATLPVLTSAAFQATDRIQSVEFAGLRYFAGARPWLYDGRIPSEQGFAELPAIISATPSNGAGALANSATYDYVVHWEYTTSDGSFIQSPVSEVTQATTGAAQDTMTVVATTPHSVRVAAGDALYGSDVVAVLSRTGWDETAGTVPTLTGTESLDPPQSSLDGLTLVLYYNDGSSGAFTTVTFDSGSTSLAAVVQDVNDDTSGSVTASAHGGFLRLTADDAGEGVQLYVAGGTALAILGLSQNQGEDGANGVGVGSQRSEFKRTATATIPSGMAAYGATVSLTDLTSDADLEDNETIYTQSARGPFGGMLEHNAPQASVYVTATESRLVHGGLLSRSSIQISKEAFPGEPIAWSVFSSFFAKVIDDVLAVEALDGAKVVFCADTILSVGGRGPDDLGGGVLDGPVEIPCSSGLKSWTSFLREAGGLWFQLDDDKLFRMPRGSGSPEWAGAPIKRLLADYPDVIAATKTRRDNAAVFACRTEAKDDAVLAVLDFRTGIWLHDSPPLTTDSSIESMVPDGDSLSYLSGGVVFRQSTSGFSDNGAVIVTLLETEPIYPFGLGTRGLVHDVVGTFEYQSAGTLAARVSFDDGQTFTTLTSFILTGLTAGDTLRKKWALPRIQAHSIVFELTFTPSSVGEGLVMNELDVYGEPSPGVPQLNPGDCG